MGSLQSANAQACAEESIKRPITCTTPINGVEIDPHTLGDTSNNWDGLLQSVMPLQNMGVDFIELRFPLDGSNVPNFKIKISIVKGTKVYNYPTSYPYYYLYYHYEPTADTLFSPVIYHVFNDGNHGISLPPITLLKDSMYYISLDVVHDGTTSGVHQKISYFSYGAGDIDQYPFGELHYRYGSSITSGGSNDLFFKLGAVSCSGSSYTNVSLSPADFPYIWEGDTLTAFGIHRKIVNGHNYYIRIDVSPSHLINITDSINGIKETYNTYNIYDNHDFNIILSTPAGYMIQSVYIDGVYVGNDDHISILNVQAPHNIHVNYIPYGSCISTSSITNINLCSSLLPYLWNGISCTSAGSYTKHLLNAAGCDSLATLNISLYTPPLTPITGASGICLGTSTTLTNATSGGTWGSIDPSVATISPTTGVVTSVSNGFTIINYTATNSSGCLATAEYYFSVYEEPLDPVVGTTAMCRGTTALFTTTASGGAWHSSDATVATVSATGLVRALTDGFAEIKYSVTTSSGCVASASLPLDVSPFPISPIFGSSNVCVGSSIVLFNSTMGGTWSSIAGRATVTGMGFTTGTSAGTARIRYSLPFAGTTTCPNYVEKLVTVNALPAIPSINYSPINTVNPQRGASGAVPGTIAICNSRTFILRGSPSGGSWTTTGGATVTPIDAQDASVTSTTLGAASILYTITTGAGCSNSQSKVATIVACAAKGINTTEMGDLNYKIYPNPAKNIANVYIENAIGNTRIIITNILGNKVLQQNLSMGNNVIDISKFSKGVYLVNIISNTTNKTDKFIVE